MANLDSIVTVNITVQDSAPTQAGFGTPMILTHESPFGPELIRSYTDTTSMVSDGFSATGATVAAATNIFAQNPKVTEIKVGRRGSAATVMTRVVTVTTVLDSTVYTVTINGTAFSFTSDATATAAEISLGLTTAINLGSEPVTAVDGVGFLTLTEDVAGVLFGLTYSFDILTSDDTTTDAGITADYAAVKAEDDDFFGVGMTSSSTLETEALSTAVEADRKIFGANSHDSDILTNTSGNLFEVCALAARNRTYLIYNLDNFDFAGLAWMGERLPSNPGSSTWAFKTISNVVVDPLSNTQITNIETNDGNHYTRTAGINITLQGTMCSGRFIDITRGIDFIQARMQEALFGQLVNTEKVPYTQIGVGSLETIVRAQLSQAVRLGILAASPEFTVTVPDVLDPSQVSTTDKTTRNLPGMTFTGTLAGAIHSMTLNGFVST